MGTLENVSRHCKNYQRSLSRLCGRAMIVNRNRIEVQLSYLMRHLRSAQKTYVDRSRYLPQDLRRALVPTRADESLLRFSRDYFHQRDMRRTSGLLSASRKARWGAVAPRSSNRIAWTTHKGTFYSVKVVVRVLAGAATAYFLLVNFAGDVARLRVLLKVAR